VKMETEDKTNRLSTTEVETEEKKPGTEGLVLCQPGILKRAVPTMLKREDGLPPSSRPKSAGEVSLISLLREAAGQVDADPASDKAHESKLEEKSRGGASPLKIEEDGYRGPVNLHNLLQDVERDSEREMRPRHVLYEQAEKVLFEK